MLVRLRLRGLLLYLEEDQDRDAVHEGGVKLKVLCCGADVITSTQDSCRERRGEG